MCASFNRRYNKMIKDNFVDENTTIITNFQNIIGLQNTANGIYNISVEKYDRYLLLKIKYKHTQFDFDIKKHTIKELPIEINYLISEYLPCEINLTYMIMYSGDYPFKPPVWSLVSCDERLASCLKNAQEYYEYITDNHNNTNALSWSPAICIDVDILFYISRINHFENIMHIS